MSESSNTDAEEGAGNLVYRPRIAEIASHKNKYIGVCIYLSVNDLQALGIEPTGLSSDSVEYGIDASNRVVIVQPLNR